MRILKACLIPCLLACLVPAARADYQFDTASTATLTLHSELFVGDEANLSASGIQHFTIDPTSRNADVTSSFKGTDFPTPIFGATNYELYNTTTSGDVMGSAGNYTIGFELLFELKLTSGPLAGVVFETKSNSFFETTGASLPFAPNTVFADPNLPNDRVDIYLKSDPNGVLSTMFQINPGDTVGYSFNRVVTALRPVPEPAAFASLSIGLAAAGWMLRRRRAAA